LSCSKTAYEANVSIFFSKDGGSSYGTSTNDFQIGERIYGLILLEANASPSEHRYIDVRITFSGKDEIIYRNDGDETIMRTDDKNVEKIYFDVSIITNTQPWVYIFEFTVSEFSLVIEVNFDELITSNYDRVLMLYQ
jgi:hypothetical protein